MLAPLILLELNTHPAWVGVYFGLTSVAALFGQLGSGGFIIRHGAVRMSQIALLSNGQWHGGRHHQGSAWLCAVGAGRQRHRRRSHRRKLANAWPMGRPALRTIRLLDHPTAIPAGILLGGWLGPAVAQSFGWRGAMLVSAATCGAFALLLQPLRGELDTDPVPTHPIHLSDFMTTVTGVIGVRELRALSFAFNGLQSVFIAYFVTYLTALGYDLVAAGSLFSTVIGIAIPCRILWGWVGSFHVAPRFVMAGLAFGMAVCAVLGRLHHNVDDTGDRPGHRWPERHRDVVAPHSLAESARLARFGRAGAVTGGVLSFGQMGAFPLPLSVSPLLRVTGSHTAGWAVCAIPALLVGLDLLRNDAGRFSP